MKIGITCLMLMAAFQPCNAMLTEHIKQKGLEQTVRHRMVQKIKAGKAAAINATQGSVHMIVGGLSASGWGGLRSAWDVFMQEVKLQNAWRFLLAPKVAWPLDVVAQEQ